MTKTRTIAVVALMLVASVVPATATVAAAESGGQSSAYAGSHVEFDAASNAVVGYTVNGETMVESVKVQSQSTAESSGSVNAGVSLASVLNLSGAGLTLAAESETSATVEAESGATLTAHDNENGILVVAAGEESQYVEAGVGADASAEARSDSRVVVTTDSGAKGTFIVVGDGEVTVNEEGNVSADLASDSRLAFRAYGESRSDADAEVEQLIADGTAAAEVHVVEQGESTTTDVVTYSSDMAVEVSQQSEGTVEMTAERSASEGKVVVTSVSNAVIESTENLEVTVDGEAAARASSYSELAAAADDGSTSKFMVKQAASASANAQVLVGLNHFSSRQVTMTEGDSGGSDTSTGGDADTTASDDADTTEAADTTESDGAPGFTAGLGLLSLLGAALLATRRS